MSYLPELDLEQLDPAQRERFLVMEEQRGGAIRGMYRALFHHPDLAMQVSPLGTFLRFEGQLGGDVREAAILATAAATGAGFVWQQHEAPARQAGLDEGALETIKLLETEGLSAPVGMAVRVAAEIARVQPGAPGTSLLKEVEDELGLQSLIELVTLCGFYHMIGAVARTFRVDLPRPDDPPF